MMIVIIIIMMNNNDDSNNNIEKGNGNNVDGDNMENLENYLFYYCM